MVNVEKLSDAELRAELIARGVNTGPVTGTTRSLFEKKLKKLLKTPAKVVPEKSIQAAPEKPTPGKPAAVKNTPNTKPKGRPSVSPARKTVRPVTPDEQSESDENESSDEDEDEIVSPKPNRGNLASPRRPVSSTPTKITAPVAHLNESISSSYSTKSSRANKTTAKNATDTSSYLSTFTSPSFTSSSILDRPGATPPRTKAPTAASLRQSANKAANRTSLTASSLISSPRSAYNKTPSIGHTFSRSGGTLGDIGATTGEEDNDSDDGIETSRVIYNSKENSEKKRGLVGTAWNKVLGYDFKASATPGQSYDFRTGSTRTKVVRDPKTGKYNVKQSNVFGEALYMALYVLVILFVVLAIGYILSISDTTKIGGSSISVLSKTIRDTINFFYRYAIIPVLTALGIGLLGVGAYFGHKKYKEAKEKEEAELFDLIEKITELIRGSTIDGEPYVSQPHVRDVIFPPAKRRGAELSRWERAVAFIDAHESRINTEIRVLPSGNECAVWKWIGNTQQKRKW